jgi:hypothetical protein
MRVAELLTFDSLHNLIIWRLKYWRTLKKLTKSVWYQQITIFSTRLKLFKIIESWKYKHGSYYPGCMRNLSGLQERNPLNGLLCFLKQFASRPSKDSVFTHRIYFMISGELKKPSSSMKNWQKSRIHNLIGIINLGKVVRELLVMSRGQIKRISRDDDCARVPWI